ncbi:MAG: alpha/beta hydrolase [Gammaproteobacteria bacterium]|nr:alpha/beta hydrolase [Gammaproteobacteria bacterium]
MTTRLLKNILLSTMLAIVSLNAVAAEVKQKFNDLTLNANLELANGKVPGDSIILMTHGTLAHGKMEITNTLQNLFKENGIDSLAITLGLGVNDRKGMYDCATTHTHKHTDAVDEIAFWVNWLQQQGVKNIILLGHSRGGNQTAWYAAERADESIRKVVLIAPATWNEKYAAEAYKERYKEDLMEVLAKAESLVKNGKGQEVMKNTGHIYCENTAVTAESFVSYNKPDMRFDTPYLLNKIKQPVLVFAGSKDDTVKDLDKKVGPQVKAGKIELSVIDGAGHMFRDLYTDEIVEQVVEFLEKN